MEWDTVVEYFVKRPWHKIINITPSMFFDVMHKKGLLDTSIITKGLKPLFNACDINEDISLLEFYDKTGIELVLYTIPVNTYDCISLSYKSHPELSVLKAVEMTCALPYVFQPVLYNDEYYIDGGLLNNYPLPSCINKEDIDKSTVLSLKLQAENILELNKDSNLFEYGYFLYCKMISVTSKKYKVSVKIENEILIPCLMTNANDAYNVLMDENERISYIKKGEEFAKLFLTYKHSDPIKFDSDSNSSEEEVERNN
tara:strand:- start:460 stop:1227 length:768 start_codon:yes stop_codon:yes gene_type:complete